MSEPYCSGDLILFSSDDGHVISVCRAVCSFTLDDVAQAVDSAFNPLDTWSVVAAACRQGFVREIPAKEITLKQPRRLKLKPQAAPSFYAASTEQLVDS